MSWNHGISDVDLAWVAGLLEGEGCFRFRLPSKRTRGNPDVQINMTDEDIIQRINDIVKIGKMYGPYFPSAPRKPFWTWKISSGADAAAFMEVIQPLMGVRRSAQIDTVLAAYKNQIRGTVGRNAQPNTWSHM